MASGRSPHPRAAVAICLLLPSANALGGARIGETLIGLAAAVFINIMAQVVLARNPRRHDWLPFAATYDTTTTTGVLVLLASGSVRQASTAW